MVLHYPLNHYTLSVASLNLTFQQRSKVSMVTNLSVMTQVVRLKLASAPPYFNGFVPLYHSDLVLADSVTLTYLLKLSF